MLKNKFTKILWYKYIQMHIGKYKFTVDVQWNGIPWLVTLLKNYMNANLYSIL